MVWKKTVAEVSSFDKIPCAGIIGEYFVNRHADDGKYGKETLDVKIDMVDLKTLEPLNKERTVRLSLNTKGWTDSNGTFTAPWYAEVQGLIVLAGTKGCIAETDAEVADPNDDKVPWEIFEMKFTPDIIGAFVRFGVRESKKKDAKEGEAQVFKNYTVEEFELKGIPAKKTETPKVAQAEAPVKAATPRGRGRAAVAATQAALPVDPKLQFDARNEFRSYLDYLSTEVSRVLTAKKIVSNMDDYTFSSEVVKAFVIDNATTLITEFQESGELANAPDGEGKYLFVGKTEE